MKLREGIRYRTRCGKETGPLVISGGEWVDPRTRRSYREDGLSKHYPIDDLVEVADAIDWSHSKINRKIGKYITEKVERYWRGIVSVEASCGCSLDVYFYPEVKKEFMGYHYPNKRWSHPDDYEITPTAEHPLVFKRDCWGLLLDTIDIDDWKKYRKMGGVELYEALHESPLYATEEAF